MLSALSASARSWPIAASGDPCSTVGRIGDRLLVLGREPVDVREAGVELRLGEEHEVADDLRLAGGEHLGDLGVHVARPRPAADVLDARVVDRDDRDAVGGRAVGRAHAHVVGLALEALDQVGTGEEEKDDRDREAEKPVLRPETCRLHLKRPLCSCRCSRLRIPWAGACGGFYARVSRAPIWARRKRKEVLDGEGHAWRTSARGPRSTPTPPGTALSCCRNSSIIPILAVGYEIRQLFCRDLVTRATSGRPGRTSGDLPRDHQNAKAPSRGLG